MAANLATNAAGEAAFISLREIPWHKQGIVVQDEMSGLDFIRAAGLDYDMLTTPITCEVTVGGERRATGWDKKTDSPIMQLVGGQPQTRTHAKLAVYRSDTGDLLPETVGQGFELFQNREIIEFFEGLVREKKIVYECAGALGVGEEVWVLAHIPDLSMSIRGDDNRSYMLIRNGHCGNATLQCFPTTIRVVCANTMAMARCERQSTGERWNTVRGGYFIRHTRNMRQMVLEVQKAYGQVMDDFVKQQEMYEFLAGKPVTPDQRQQFFRWFALEGRDEKKIVQAYGKQDEGQALTRGEKTTITRFEATVDKLDELYESPTNQNPGTRNTVYSLLQTAIEYVDHERTTRCGEGDDCDYKRFESAIFGSGAQLKNRATEQALELALAI